MSVFMVLRVKGDPKQLEQYAQANGAKMQAIAAEGRAAGAIRHAFAGGDGEILVIDEWPDEASFQKFFANQPDIPALMQAAGAQGAPEVTFYRKLETTDAF
jgi:hypothetical protein